MRLEIWKTCPACGNEISGVTTVSGKTMPVNPEPAKRGNVLVYETRTGESAGRVLGGAELTDARASGTTLYMPHFATCSDPARFRSES